MSSTKALPRSRKINVGAPVHVDWLDAASDNASWKTRRRARKHRLAVMRSLGFVLRYNKTMLLLGMTGSEGSRKSPGQTTGLIAIPSGSIRAIRRIR